MSQPLRVVIVEDRPSDAEALALRLEEAGFELRWVRVDAEAAYLAELAVAPDLILSDWTLPHFSGLGALRSVRGRGMDTPFVIVSGSVGEETAIDAMHEGADDYVLKDRLARLGPAVRRALDNRRSRDDRRRADAQLRQAAMVFESSNEAITLTDVDGTIVAVNRAFTEITGYDEAEVLGRNPSILQSGRQDPGFYRDLWATLAATGRWRGEIWNRRKNGEVYPEWLTISAVRDEQGRTTHYVSMSSDTGDAKRNQEQLVFFSRHDPLTGLPNGVMLRDHLAQALPRARQRSSVVAVLLLDIDRFGRVNEGLGQAVGDGLLKATSWRLDDALESGDTLARYMADKFVIVVEDGQSATHVAHRARAYQDRIAAPFDVDGHELVVTCSVGISMFPADGTDVTTLLHLADAAMRQARLLGGNHMAFVDAGVARQMEDRLQLERLLRGAVGRNELVVHYQPQVSMTDRSLVGVEALVRWQHPHLGLVPPSTFIPLAEELGIIDEIGEWVLAEACHQLVVWDAVGLSVPRVAVNLSARQLGRESLPVIIRAALESADVGPERLELEVTESAVMGSDDTAARVLADLHRLNVDLVMDDFGTGYSSMAQLMRLPLRRLKIDISFVRDIGNPAAEAIIRATIALAGSLGLQTVAEGVEHESQAEFLRDAGCDIGQGYLFGRPVPPDALCAAWR